MSSLEIADNLNELIEHPLCVEFSFYKQKGEYLIKTWHEEKGPSLHKALSLGEALWAAVEHFKSNPNMEPPLESVTACSKNVLGCLCAVAWPTDKQCVDCREDNKRSSRCICPIKLS